MRLRIVAQPGRYSGGDHLVVGEEYDFADDEAMRWLRRGVAVAVEPLTRHQAAVMASVVMADVRVAGDPRGEQPGVLTINHAPVAVVEPKVQT